MSSSGQTVYDGSEIAICGMAGRFPGAADIPALWRNLRDGVQSISTLSEKQARAAEEDPEIVDSANYVRARSILEDVDRFDAAFFGFAPSEAEVIDPQERLLLECIWEVLEQAGYDTQRFKGHIGLFAGASLSTYLAHQLYRNREVMKAFGDTESTIYNSAGTVATLAAYKLNLKGPCCSIQTFCSTSLVAVHMACQSLLNFESDLAVAGGSTIYCPQERGYLYQEGGIVSPDGKCRPFDAEASGTVFGNGVAVVVMKRLKDALQDGDTIHAIIRGSAVNNDGSLKVSYAAPSVVGQTEVIVEALGAAGVDPQTIGFVETHGTGTRLGDPAEVEALTKAFRTRTKKNGFCAIGSIKANVGHLDAAAGVTGLIKTVLSLKHKQIPPSINCDRPNPLIDFENSPFFVNTALKAWESGSQPRRAAVSAFGIGGTNAHVVLEEAPAAPPAHASRSHHVVVLSAKTRSALDEATRRLAVELRSNPDLDLADVAYTLQVGRREFGHRRMLVADSASQAISLLESPESPTVWTVRQDRRDPPVTFLFAGQDAARVNMARELYEQETAFRRDVDQGFELARSFGDVKSALYPADDRASRGFADDLMGQLALFIVEYALARLWQSWGVRPQAVAGAGIGEYAAACVAGVFSFEDGLALVGRRGAARSISLSVPRVPLLSGRSGAKIDPQETTSLDRWTTSSLEPFTVEALGALSADEQRILLQIGPASTVSKYAALRPEDDSRSDVHHAVETLGRLWLEGATVDWTAFHGDRRRRRVPLPTYPFDRQRFWVDPAPVDEPPPPPDPLEKIAAISRWFYVPEWRQTPPAAFRATRSFSSGSRWVVFADSGELSAHVVSHLETAVGPDDVIVVARGDHFEKVDSRTFLINPRSREDYTTLFSELEGSGRLPEVIAHLWLADGLPSMSSAEVQHLGFYSLIWLAQAINARRRPDAGVTTIKIVTSELHDISGGDRIRPEKATVLGPCIVVSQEQPDIKCCVVDLAPGDVQDGRSEAVAGRIVGELLSDTPERMVGYRGARRWAPYFEAVPVDPQAEQRVKLRERGVYLITGGLGSIGSVFADYLARTVRARLVLVNRTPLPPRSQWDGWVMAHAPDDPVSARIAVVQQLERAGSEVMLGTADVADHDQMSNVVAAAVQRFGPLNGVIGAAGLVDSSAFKLVDEIGPGDCDAQFRTKIQGLTVLEDVLEGHPLDFCFVVSSLSSVLGGLGYAGYSASNLFMDAFVRRHNQNGSVPWLAANWDAWSFERAGARTGAAGRALARFAITETEGTSVFEHLLAATGLGQVVISTANLSARITNATEIPATSKASRDASAPAAAAESHGSVEALIETALNGHPAIKETLVLSEEAIPGERRYVAYTVYRPRESLTVSELRRFARANLTESMVPSFFVKLEQIPRTPDGQIDRRALPNAFGVVPESGRVPPTTPTEQRIAAIWQKALGITSISVEDNFFDVGGHSLLSIRVLGEIERTLGHRLSPRAMFMENLKQIAEWCDRRSVAVERTTS